MSDEWEEDGDRIVVRKAGKYSSADIHRELFTRDDAAQVRVAERFIESGAWVSHVVLTEMTFVLLRVRSRR